MIMAAKWHDSNEVVVRFGGPGLGPRSRIFGPMIQMKGHLACMIQMKWHNRHMKLL